MSATYFETNFADAPNYEDLMSILNAINGETSHQTLDPTVAPYVSAMRARSEQFWHGFPVTPFLTHDEFGSLVHEAQLFVQCVVRSLLDRRSPPVGLDTLARLVEQLNHADIVTLNHDLLIEGRLAQAGVGFSDGFSTNDGEARFFDETALERAAGIRMLKPHGSVSWFRVRTPDRPGIDRYAVFDGDPGQSRDGHGRWLDNMSGHPAFLSGTNNKIASYHSGIFAAQISLFRRSLAGCSKLVCCGYGWKDRGITSMVADWFWRYGGRLMILHPRFQDEFLEYGKQPIHHNILLRQINATGRLVVHPAWLCDTGDGPVLDFLCGRD